MATTIGSAVDLWKELQRRAGLDIKNYDVDFLQELKDRLGLSHIEGSFTRALAQSKVTIESLVDTFLSLVRPYAGMTRDVLLMFEGAGASRSRDNLRMRF